MALAQQINSFGSNHPGLNFLGGLAAGVALTAAATLGALTMQSQNNVEAASFTQTSISQELSAPRVLVANTGSPISSSDDDAMFASRMIDVRTMSVAAVATEEQTLTTPRVTVSTVSSPISSPDDDAMFASRLVDIRTMSSATVATEEQTLTAPRVTASNFGSQDISVSASRTTSSATVATEEQTLTTPRVTVSGFGSPVRSSDDDAMFASRLVDIRTMSSATVATEEQTLTAPRVTVSNVGSQDISVSAPRTISFATVATEEQTLTAPRVTVSGFGSPVRSSDDDAMSAPRVTIDQPRHGGGPSDDELGAGRVLVQ